MAWRVRLICRDCAGDNDDMGCFGGGGEVQDEVFASEADARAWAEKTCDGPPWEFDVFEDALAAQEPQR